MSNRIDQLSDEVCGRIKGVKLLILDVDGVMTDGRIVYDDEGRELKFFDVRDGHGVKLLQRTGVEVALITARSSNVVAVRAENLGIKHIYQGALNKLTAFEELQGVTGFTPEEMAYIGDDLVDLPLLRRVAFAATVPGGVSEVREESSYITDAQGGFGAVRELCELIMKVQSTWASVTERYYK